MRGSLLIFVAEVTGSAESRALGDGMHARPTDRADVSELFLDHDGAMTWTAPVVVRIDEPFLASEREMLQGFLDWSRNTLLVKCSGLSEVQLALQATPPSTLSLLGLVRHLTDVERTWFRRRFGGEAIDSLYWREDRPEAAFDDVEPARAERDVACLITEWQAARGAVAALTNAGPHFREPYVG